MDDRRGKRGLRTRNPDRSEDEKSSRPTATPAAGGGGIFKSAAVAVLRQHRKLMTTGDITRLAVEMGLLKCQGKTPEATMASALYTDVKRKLQKSLFTRPQEGLFGLREWLEEGYYPEGWVGPPDGLGLAPFKRRNNASTHTAGGGVASASGSKAGRTGVRTGPGRSSKSRAARSWRNAASDGEDDDELMETDDEPLPTGRSHLSSGPVAVAATPVAAGAAVGDDEDAEEGEGEEADMEEEAEDGEEAAVEGQDEHHGRHDAAEAMAGGAGEGDPGTGTSRDTGIARACGAQRSGSPIRRPGKGRGYVGVLDGAPPQDECLSPLHMLGDAAASESMGDMGDEHEGSPPAKRKRPSSITVPERSGGLGGVEGITPKSPYEDSLAALHEIATSPSTFELTSQREVSMRDRDRMSGPGVRPGGDMGVGTGGKVGRARPRLHVDVPNPGGDLGTGPGSRRDGGTPGTTLLTDNPMMQGETTPAILLQASPVTTANGQQAMMLRQAPVLVTLPPALASPSAASAGDLDTPALLHVQLPGGAPSEFMHTALFTPSGQQLTPLRSLGGLPPPGRGGLLKTDGSLPSARPPGRRVSFSGQVGILGPPSSRPMPLQPLQQSAGAGGPAARGAAGQQAAGAAGGGQAWPPRLTAAQVDSELTEINRVQAVVERLESRLGNTHPQVGKAWLSLARMYQHISDAERQNGSSCIGTLAKAAEALRRAWAVCRACAESCGTSLSCEEAFRYLTARTSEGGLEPVDDSAAQADEDATQGPDTQVPAEGAPGSVAPDALVQQLHAPAADGTGVGATGEGKQPAPETQEVGRQSGLDTAAGQPTPMEC